MRPPLTLGYYAMADADLLEIASAVDVLVDVRTLPHSRNARRNKAALETLLGSRYLWMGDVLGGLGIGVSEVGLDWVRRMATMDIQLALMCLDAIVVGGEGFTSATLEGGWLEKSAKEIAP